MIGQTPTTETPIETVVRARRLGFHLWLSHEGAIKVSLPAGVGEVPPWLRAAKLRDAEAFAFAVGVVAAVERSGGDPGQLLSVKTLVFEIAAQ